MQSHPLCRIHFGQYQVRWGDRACTFLTSDFSKLPQVRTVHDRPGYVLTEVCRRLKLANMCVCVSQHNHPFRT